MTEKRKSELLMPAGSLTKLKTAILYGADIVYAGTPDFSLRAKSKFTMDELLEGVEFVHSRGKKINLALNMFSHNRDVPRLPKLLDTLRQVKPDGIIIADPGVFQYVRENAPELDLHVSTQANVCSHLSVNFWKNQGAKLCVLGREVSYEELKEIREKCPDIDLEAFVHGSMCMSYSGRCLLSNFLAERGANQGSCAHCCRWNYKLKVRLKDGSVKELEINEDNKELFEFLIEEENRPGELLEVIEDKRGSYILSSKDMCLMPRLPEFLDIGIDSLKIEGRNKTQYYSGIVARAYRMAIDDYYKDNQNWDYKPYMEELLKVPNRGFTLAFHDGQLTDLSQTYMNTKSIAEYEFCGFVTDVKDDHFEILAKNRLLANDVLEFVLPEYRESLFIQPERFIMKDNSIRESVHAGQKPIIKIPFEWFKGVNPDELRKKVPQFTLIRKIKNLTPLDSTKVEFNKSAYNVELSKETRENYTEKKEIFAKEVEKEEARLDDKKKQKEEMRIKQNGNTARPEKKSKCCGQGCSDCRTFWHSDEYKEAREELKKSRK